VPPVEEGHQIAHWIGVAAVGPDGRSVARLGYDAFRDVRGAQ
jgi:hypothetical protein